MLSRIFPGFAFAVYSLACGGGGTATSFDGGNAGDRDDADVGAGACPLTPPTPGTSCGCGLQCYYFPARIAMSCLGSNCGIDGVGKGEWVNGLLTATSCQVLSCGEEAGDDRCINGEGAECCSCHSTFSHCGPC
jgi:hypothetical protein